MTRAVFVSSVGTISAAGSCSDSLWLSCLAGTPTAVPQTFELRRSQDEPLSIQVPFCGVDHHFVQAHLARRFGSAIRHLAPPSLLALYAVDTALNSTCRTSIAGPRTAVIWGSGGSAIQPIEQGYTTLLLEGRTRVNPMTVGSSMASAAAAAITHLFAITGPSFATASACASGAHAIAAGKNLIENGTVDQAIVGGSEILSDPGTVISWNSTGVLSKGSSQPFMPGRDGINLGDGAAALVLSADPNGAVARLGAVTMSTGARNVMAPEPKSIIACLEPVFHAERDLGMPIVINCHATGTRIGDEVEMSCLAELSQLHQAAVFASTTKAVTGHIMSAAGAIEAVIALMSLQHQRIPLAHVLEQGRWSLQLPATIKSHFERVYSANFGFGGMNCILSFDAM